MVFHPEEESVDKPREMKIKVPDQIAGGVYANQMVVRHTREEFLLDFINLFPPEGVVNARVILSPWHVKRMVHALNENITRYERQFGPIEEASAPTSVDGPPN
jgi:hypothetical protein